MFLLVVIITVRRTFVHFGILKARMESVYVELIIISQ